LTTGPNEKQKENARYKRVKYDILIGNVLATVSGLDNSEMA
jgi:hypothetical protein